MHFAFPLTGNTLERPFNILPASPSVIGTRFFLYTRNTRNKREEISRTSGLGSWDASKPTKITAHGFLDLPYGNIPPWWTDMKNAFLDIEDCNFILTDWSRGNGFPYNKAAVNTQIVGAEIALLINSMIKEHGASADDFHLIGHSLGAEVMGYAGERVPNLARIT
ncbi:unnamed protein product, partial [Didymodactylos carnosus]